MDDKLFELNELLDEFLDDTIIELAHKVGPIDFLKKKIPKPRGDLPISARPRNPKLTQKLRKEALRLRKLRR